jgi:cytochrome b6-f complex iron-sulfur subunit
MDRRKFVKTAGAAALLASLGIPLKSCQTDDDMMPDDVLLSFSLDDSPFNDLLTEDAWLLHPTENYLLVNVGGDIRAFTSVCTHTGCSRNWEFTNNQARCTCHSSFFNNDGTVAAGPANAPLAEFTVEVVNNMVTVKG